MIGAERNEENDQGEGGGVTVCGHERQARERRWEKFFKEVYVKKEAPGGASLFAKWGLR